MFILHLRVEFCLPLGVRLREAARWSGSAYCWWRVQADTDPMSLKCWASVASAGQYPFSPSQYFMLVGVSAHSIHRPNARYTDTLPDQWWACVAYIYRHDAFHQSWVIVGPPSVTLAHIQRGTKHDMVTQYWANVGSAL